MTSVLGGMPRIYEKHKLTEKEKKRLSYTNPYGLWKVTTEGDCEGRSSRNLGIFEGYLDDIAFYLADKAYYTLEFEKIDILRISHKNVNAERSEVNVSLDISSGTWGMSSEERVLEFKKLLSERHVRVTEGDTYASVKLCKDGI